MCAQNMRESTPPGDEKFIFPLFLMRARALVAFPGGFGTLDELFETLTLIQTKKIKPVPVLLFGREFWERVINFDFLVEEGMISPEDIEIFQYAGPQRRHGTSYVIFSAFPMSMSRGLLRHHPF
jgi:hypothetical protein